MAQNKKAHSQDEPSEMIRFIRNQVDPLSKAFAASPLARLRIKTGQGTVTLERALPAAAVSTGERASEAARTGSEAAKPQTRTMPLVPAQNGEAGRTYVTVNAEVVGIFRDSTAPPAPGEALRGGQVLGYIEALRLRNEVHCPSDATLVAQVVVDGQPVDFGEALFVVDATGARESQPPPAAVNIEAAPVVEAVEPPRM
jgi:acetyl-CoA carboxylase biotin carboxyl carrier protein